MRCIYMLVFSPTQNTSYTSSPTNSRVETFRLGSRTRAINATHNPIPRAEKQTKTKTHNNLHFSYHITFTINPTKISSTEVNISPILKIIVSECKEKPIWLGNKLFFFQKKLQLHCTCIIFSVKWFKCVILFLFFILISWLCAVWGPYRPWGANVLSAPIYTQA